jgi:hypothetical protein
MPVPTTKALAGVLPAALHQQVQHDHQHTMPSPGGQASGMAATSTGGTGPGVGRVRHPIDLPPGLPHGSPGAELPEAVAGRVVGCPRGAVWSGSAKADGMPHGSQRARSSVVAGHRKDHDGGQKEILL